MKSPALKKMRPDDHVVEEEDMAEVALPATPIAARAYRGEITMEALEGLLDRKINPINDNIQNLQTQMGKFETEIKVEVRAVQTRVSKVEDNVKMQDLRIRKIEGMMHEGASEAAMSTAQMTAAQIQTLRTDVEERIGNIEKAMKDGNTLDGKSSSITFGGFPQSGDGEAEALWIENELKRLRLEPPSGIYFKGDEFNGLLFAKFATRTAATAAMNMFNKVPRTYQTIKVKCKPDLALEPRVCRSFLLGLRYNLIQWGTFDKKAVKVDDENFSMTVFGAPVVSVKVHEDSLKLEWLDSSWATWNELMESAELAALTKTGNEKLQRAAERRMSKGAGKSKSQ